MFFFLLKLDAIHFIYLFDLFCTLYTQEYFSYVDQHYGVISPDKAREKPTTIRRLLHTFAYRRTAGKEASLSYT